MKCKGVMALFPDSSKIQLRVLALDVATKTGWATKNAHGLWDFNIKRDESNGMKFLRFRAKLKEVCQLEDINLITFERSSGMHQSSVIHQSELHGVLKLFCEDNNIEYKAYSAKEIKQFATGKGNANKEAMITAAKKMYPGFDGDDNVADAMHIYYLTVKDFDL
jgi:Holliday junction resolvasome RuvABC endonuclease subunit